MSLKQKLHLDKLHQLRMGMKHFEEAKRKISEAHKGRISSMKGKTHSLETRQKISQNSAKVWLGKTGIQHPLYGRKLTQEHRNNISLARKGIPAYNKGKKLSQETKEKISLTSKLMWNNSQFKERMSEASRGSKNPNWKGGVASFLRNLRGSFKFRQWRESVFKRDNWTCVWCKKRGGILHPDHIKMFAFYSELRFEVLNGQTLCKNCHAWKTKWDRKIYLGKVPELNIV